MILRRQRATELLTANQQRQDTYVNEGRRHPRSYAVGNYVFVSKVSQSTGKLDSGMRGPYKVVRTLPHQCYELELLAGSYGKKTQAAGEHMVLWRGEWTPETCSAFFEGVIMEGGSQSLGRGRGRGRGQGRGQPRGRASGGGGRGRQPRRALDYGIPHPTSISDDERPSTSTGPPQPATSLTDELKRIKKMKLLDKKNENLLSAEQRAGLKKLRDAKQVAQFLMPGAPPKNKRKVSPKLPHHTFLNRGN